MSRCVGKSTDGIVAMSTRNATSGNATSGKVRCCRLEQGDDLGLVEFHCAEYGDSKTVAHKKLLKRILETGN